MSMRNLQLGKIRIAVATTLTLLFSVAQSDPGNGINGFNDGLRPFERGVSQAYLDGFLRVNENGFIGGSNARVALADVGNLGDFGDLSVIEMRSGDSTSMHFNYRSELTGELLSATLRMNRKTDVAESVDSSPSDVVNENPLGGFSAADYSLSFDLPQGQIVFENGKISILDAEGFAQADLSQLGINNLGNDHFISSLGKVLTDSGMDEFSFAMDDSLQLNTWSELDDMALDYGKGDQSQIQGGWACTGALLALAGANAALAVAVGLTYATLGAMAASVAAAVSAITSAVILVDVHCNSMFRK